MKVKVVREECCNPRQCLLSKSDPAAGLGKYADTCHVLAVVPNACQPAILDTEYAITRNDAYLCCYC